MTYRDLTQTNIDKIEEGVAKYIHRGVKSDTLIDLKNYAVNGLPVGDFLYAVLTNDLMEAFDRADERNAATMKEIVSFVYNVLPRGCWGNAEAIKRWRGQ